MTQIGPFDPGQESYHPDNNQNPDAEQIAFFSRYAITGETAPASLNGRASLGPRDERVEGVFRAGVV